MKEKELLKLRVLLKGEIDENVIDVDEIKENEEKNSNSKKKTVKKFFDIFTAQVNKA